MSERRPDPSSPAQAESVWPRTQVPASGRPDEPLDTLAGAVPPLALPVPAATRPDAAAIVGAIRRLRLLEGERLAQAEQLAAAADAEAVCRELLNRQWLTALQANRLLSGEGDRLCVGGCVLLRRLGAGGMGMVFEARQLRMGRAVAIKLMHNDYLASEEAVRRFRREVAATSRLEHPNVVRALDAGLDGQTHYLVLELVEGADLSRVVAQRGALPPHEACEYVRQAALGLQHANEHGLVHRDVKPSNLILTAAADGKPVVKVLDLGLSRSESTADGDSTSLTNTGAVMGTPDFMAPEQIRDSKRSDVRSDLYSLGCTLYFLLVGRPPFGGATLGLKLVQHQMDEPEPVESLRPQVPAAVAAVVRKLMAKKPEDRYQTPGELARVLAGILRAANWSPATAFSALRGDATEVVNPPSLTPRRPWSLRRLALAAASAVAAVALLGATVWLLTRPAPLPPPQPPSDYALDRLQSKAIPRQEVFAWQPPELVQVLGEHHGRHWGQVNAVEFSSDGKVVYAASSRRLIAWDVPTLRPIGEAEIGLAPRVVGLIQEGQTLFVSDRLAGVSFHDPRNLRKTASYPKWGPRVVSPDGKFALYGFEGGGVHLLHLAEGGVGGLLADGFDRTLTYVGVAFSCDGKLFAHAASDGSILVRETAAPDRVTRRLEGYPGKVATALRFSPSGKWLAAGSGVGTVDTRVSLWYLPEGRRVKEWNVGPLTVAVDFVGPDRHGDPRQLAAFLRHGSSGAVILSLDDKPRSLGNPIYSTRGLSAMAASPDGKLLALGDDQGRVRLWDVQGGAETVPTRDNQGRVNSLALSPDGKWLLSTGTGERAGQAILWDVESARSTRFEGKAANLRGVAVAADGESFFVGDDSGDVYRHSPAADEPGKPLASLGCRINALHSMPDGRVAAAGETKGKLVLVDPQTKGVKALTGFDLMVDSLASGGQGERFRLAVRGVCEGNSKGAWVKLYSGDGEPLESLSAERADGAYALAVSPDGTKLATGGYKKVLLWDVDRLGEQPSVVTSTTNTVSAVAFFPDGKSLAIADHDGVVQVRTTDKGTLLQRWQMPGPVHALAVDRRGEYLITGNGNGTAYVLRLAGPR